MTDLLTLRQARTKLLDALAAAQREELPRSERSLAEQQRRRLHNALQVGATMMTWCSGGCWVGEG